MRFTLFTSAVGLTVLSGCAVLYGYDDYDTSGAGGQGGSKPPTTCNLDSDCTVENRECATAVCKKGECASRNEEEGTSTETQTAGDCKTTVCDGRGRTKEIPDDDDVQVDSNDCTRDICADGDPEHPFEEPGTPCGSSDVMRCDTAGRCVGCTADDECPPPTSCAESRCRDGTCTTQLQPEGTVCAPPACSNEFTRAVSRCDTGGSCVTTTEECGQFRCAPEGCPTSCSDSSQCLTGFHCDRGTCSDCSTCSDWLSGLVASSTASFCDGSAALHSRVVSCFCQFVGGLCPDSLECHEAICTGTTAVPGSCLSCLERCDSVEDCSADAPD
jgi:hypothetical protein